MKLLLLTLTLCPLALAASHNASASAAAATSSAADVKAALSEIRSPLASRSAHLDPNVLQTAADEKRASAIAHGLHATAVAAPKAAPAQKTLQRFPDLQPVQGYSKPELDAFIRTNFGMMDQHVKNLYALLIGRIQQSINSILPISRRTADSNIFGNIPPLYNLTAEYAAYVQDSPASILSEALASFTPNELGGVTIHQWLKREFEAFQAACKALDDAVTHEVGAAFQDSFASETVGAHEGLSEDEQKLFQSIGLRIEGAGETTWAPLTYWIECSRCRAQFKPGFDHSYYHGFCQWGATTPFAFNPSALPDQNQQLWHVLLAIDLESHQALNKWHRTEPEWRKPDAAPPSPDLEAWELLQGIRNSLIRQKFVWNKFLNNYSAEDFESDRKEHHNPTQEDDSDEDSSQ